MKQKLLIIFSVIIFISLSLIYYYVTEKSYNNKLTVEFINVGNGDSIFIRLPDKKTMLIDSGEITAFSKVQKTLNKYNVRSIDYGFLSHQHKDHVGSYAKIMNVYPVKKIFMPKTPIENPETDMFLSEIKRKNVPVQYIKHGDVILSGDVYAKVLTPFENETYCDENDYSAALYLKYKNTAFLFMGDLNKGIESLLLEKYKNEVPKANVIKLGHHGSDTSTFYPFLEAVSPKYAVISTGDFLPKRPSENMKKLLSSLKIKAYTTLDDGNIRMISDGKKISVTCEN